MKKRRKYTDNFGHKMEIT